MLEQASDTTLRPQPDIVIPSVVAGTVNILKTAARQNSIKRVVLTSSSTAVLIPTPNERRSVDQSKVPGLLGEGYKPLIILTDTWNDDVLKAVWSEAVPLEKKPYIVYAAAKTEAERQAWNWVAKNKPDFGFNVVVPNINVSENSLTVNLCTGY
jgi:nucleoside-diphosphate-sugar epimerase